MPVAVDPRTPVIVGSGQVTQRVPAIEDAREPIELMVEAAERAAEDAGAPELLRRADSIRVPQGLWKYENPARYLGERFGAERPETATSAIAGTSVQGMLNDAAAAILAGERDVVLIVGGEEPAPTGNDLTCLAYTVRKGESGALHRLLAPFAEHGVNLTAIHARPLAGTPWEYVFFLDVEGHPSEAHVAAACENAAGVANSYRILGAFPRAIAARRGGEGEA